MDWLQLSLETTAPAALEEALWAAGALAVTLQDAADTPVLEPPPDQTPLWPGVKVTGLFESQRPVETILGQLRLALAAELPPHQAELLEDRDWVREWLTHFQPLRCGRRLWICPTQYQVHEPDAVVIKLDPGLAFGTGMHPTTALCLDWLDSAELTGRRLLDYGCGSGILAVAAARLGALSVCAIDSDPQALQATRDNAARNGVQDRLTVTPPEAWLPGLYDVVVANILAGPLIELAPRLATRVAADGWLILSGLLQEQAAEVAAAYATWIDWQPPTMRQHWARLAGRRRR